ncbi:DUF1330 domain-containing protein [Cupriavidus sp. MP-37]|uniref:DUF1330 domain-containing protein n=1 Tax=Cupriavidus sp. MP-37 TaxID=2884455 RepID=UPI001D0B502F|nr:DUF1330 domain-containing protein [Cupriavidus sp. MP-37]UDM51966.1 DUF1330 domain-containing protein [Cupriavidus sp. MP-37]
MRKGYWIALVDVTDIEGYKGYIAANQAVFEKFGGRFIIRNGEKIVVEGSLRSRVVVIEFEDYQTALACYRSSEYRAAMSLRQPFSQGDIVVIEGYEELPA